MSDVAVLAAFAGIVVVVLASVVRSLLSTVRALTRANIAKNAQELSVLERADAALPRPLIPFVGRHQAPLDDDDDLLPMGLSG